MTTRFTFLLRALAVALMASLARAMPAVANDDDLGTYVHEGTCDTIRSKVEEIDDLDLDDDDDRIWQRIGGGDPLPDRFWAEDDDVDMSLQSLIDGEYVITVHEHEDSDAPVITCGAIAGELEAGGGLLIDLEEADGSGFEGRASLIPDDDDDDDETDIDIGVWETAAATPGA